MMAKILWLIDDNEYRKKNGINKIKGIIYNDGSSDILEQFVNYFDSDGRLVGSNGYDANFILTDTSQIFYDYNQYIGYCEINITLQDHKLNMDISINWKRLYSNSLENGTRIFIKLANVPAPYIATRS